MKNNVSNLYKSNNTRTSPSTQIIFGQSLGGANAIAVVAQNDFKGIKAVIIEGTFYSYKSIAKEKVVKMTKASKENSKKLVDALIDDAHSPGPLVEKISPIPLLVVHGTDDKIVPFQHCQQIIRKAKKPKQLWVISNGGHIEAFTKYGKKYRPKLTQFIKESINKKSKDVLNPPSSGK